MKGEDTLNKIIVIDFSGTLIMPEVAEEANLLRYILLGIPEPTKEEHKRLHASKKHYDIIKEYISKNLGINDEMKVKYVNNYGKRIELNGKDVKTMIMTDREVNMFWIN